VHIRVLKVPHEDALEVYPRMDAVRGEMLEPCSRTFHKVERQVFDDEEIIVHPTHSTGEAEVFQPHGEVCVPRGLDDIWRHVEAR
jgi:hypothetical protein